MNSCMATGTMLDGIERVQPVATTASGACAAMASAKARAASSSVPAGTTFTRSSAAAPRRCRTRRRSADAATHCPSPHVRPCAMWPAGGHDAALDFQLRKAAVARSHHDVGGPASARCPGVRDALTATTIGRCAADSPSMPRFSGSPGRGTAFSPRCISGRWWADPDRP